MAKVPCEPKEDGRGSSASKEGVAGAVFEVAVSEAVGCLARIYTGLQPAKPRKILLLPHDIGCDTDVKQTATCLVVTVARETYYWSK